MYVTAIVYMHAVACVRARVSDSKPGGAEVGEGVAGRERERGYVSYRQMWCVCLAVPRSVRA